MSDLAPHTYIITYLLAYVLPAAGSDPAFHTNVPAYLPTSLNLLADAGSHPAPNTFLLTYLLTYLLTHVLTYLCTYFLTHFLTYLLAF